MEYESSSSIWDGVYYYPHLFGGLMLTAALLGLSTSYFGGLGFSSLPYMWSDLGFFIKRSVRRSESGFTWMVVLILCIMDMQML